MDAKHAKTLSGVVIALFIMSALAPLAGASSHRGTSAPDVVVNADETFTVTSPVSGTFNQFVSGGPIQFNESKDLIVTNLTGNENDRFVLRAGNDGPLVQSGLAQSSGGGQVNATWAASSITATSSIAGKFNQVGAWYVFPAGNTTTPVATILVNATENLNVQLSTTSFAYTTGDVTFQITVTNAADGTPAAGVDVDLSEFAPEFTDPVQTNVDGVYDYFGKVSRAGTFTITASRDQTGDGLPEFQGSAELSVTAAQLDATAVATDVLRGFAGNAVFNFTLPGASQRSIADVGDYTLNLTMPNGSWVRYTGTGAGTPAVDAQSSNAVTGEITISVNSRGNVTVNHNPGGNGWASGTYRLGVNLNTQGPSYTSATGGTAEYQATVSWSPGTPAAVNVQIEPSVLDVQNRGATNGLPAPQSVEVTVTGSTMAEHPSASFFDLEDNVTLSGDFLVLTTEDGTKVAPTLTGYNEATGEFTIGNLYPTRGGGQINVAVDWKGSTWSKSITVRNGGAIEADQDTVVVDQTSTITFTLRLPSGSIDPSGTVRVFRVTDGTTAVTPASGFGETAVAGTGAAGAGLDGQYEFTVKPTRLGTYVVYGEVGDDLGDAGDYRNWTYTTFRVVPAHDLSVDIVKGQSFLGSTSTSQAINVTLPSGDTLDDTPSIYVMNERQQRDFLANGTLPTAVTGVSVYTQDGNVRSYNYTLSLGTAGSYSVYVVSTDGKHDNRDSMPTFEVTRASVSFSPNAVVNNRNIASNTTISLNLTVPDGASPNGTLVFNPTASTGRALFYGEAIGNNASWPTITVQDGKASFNVTGVSIGTLRFDYRPGGSGAGTLTEGALEVQTPNVIVNPSQIPVGRASTVSIVVKDLQGNNLSGLNVRICGPPIGGACTGEATTDQSGQVTLGVNPFSTGNLTMQVNRQNTTTNVTVFAGLVITPEPPQPDVGDEVVLHVAQIGQSGEPGVNVVVTPQDGNESVFEGSTNNLGIVRWTPDEEGTYTVRATKQGFQSASTTIEVGAAEEQPEQQEAKFELSDLTISPDEVELGREALATVQVTNSGEVEGTTTVRLKVNGVTLQSTSVTLGPGQSDTVGLSFSPNQAGTYEVTVALPDGTQAGPATLTVSEPEQPDPQQPPADGGDGDGDGTGDGADGGTDGPGGDGGGIPGFEAVFVLAALGAALLVVGRRK